MKIALIGYGKMGQTIEEIAMQRGHEIVLRITSTNRHEMEGERLRQAEVAIEFTRPDAARENVLKCLAAEVDVVSGTTGWNDHLKDASDYARKHDLAFLHASNFSIGVNIFFEVNKLLASLMNGRTEYHAIIDETHHTQKKDAPSGTAITLADQIVERVDNLKGWELNDINEKDALPILAHRIENVPGTHKISWNSAIDSIEITHTAHNRNGFALGAVLAAEYINGRNGTFTMKDVLGIK